MDSVKNREGRTSPLDATMMENDRENAALAQGVSITRELPESRPTWPNRFLRKLVAKKLNGMLGPKEMRTCLEKRFEFSSVFGVIKSDWEFTEFENKWNTGLSSRDGEMLLIKFDLDWRNPRAIWVREYYTKIARLEPAPIPSQFLGKVIVSNHSCIRQNIRAKNGFGDAFKCITENLINLAIQTQRPLDRAFYQSSIQYLIPLPQGGVAIVKLDWKNCYTCVPTTLNTSQAEILRLTANPMKAHIPSNHKQQIISGSVVV